MKKSFSILLLILLIVQVAVAQKYISNPETRSIVLNYPDSTVKFEILNIEKSIKFNDKLNYYWYATNKISVNRGGIGGKPLHGDYHVSSKLGGLITQGVFKFGLKDGNWKYWYSNGELQKSENWDNGKLNGKQVNYNRLGKITSELNYKDGLLNGKCLYHETDTILIKEFKNGEKVVKTEKEPFLKRIFKKKEKVENAPDQPQNTESGDKD